MAAALGWDEPRTGQEITRYRDAVAADLAAQAEPDDLGAYRASAAGPGRVPFYGGLSGRRERHVAPPQRVTGPQRDQPGGRIVEGAYERRPSSR